MVGAPQKLTKAPAGAAPPKVKAKVAQPKIEKGWAGVANEAQVKEKIKTENPKNIPPPTRAAAKGRAGAEASPGATAPAAAGGPVTSPGATGAPTEKGKGRGRPGREAQPGVTAAPDAAEIPAAAGKPTEKGKRPGRPGARPGMSTPSELPAGDASQAIQDSPPGKEHGKAGKGRLETTPPPSGQTGADLTAPEATQPPGKHKGQRERGLASPSPEQPSGGTANAPERGRHAGRPPGQAGNSPDGSIGPAWRAAVFRRGSRGNTSRKTKRTGCLWPAWRRASWWRTTWPAETRGRKEKGRKGFSVSWSSIAVI